MYTKNKKEVLETLDKMCEDCGFYNDCPLYYACPPKAIILEVINEIPEEEEDA